MISQTIFASVATILSYSVQTITARKFRAQNKFGTVACCAEILAQKMYFFCSFHYVCSKNDWQSKILSGQTVILAGYCPLTGHYFEP